MDPLLIDVPPPEEQPRTEIDHYWVNMKIRDDQATVVLTATPNVTERQHLYWEILKWLSKRWDISDDAFVLTVDGVCSGDEKVWAIWLDLAPIEKLRDGLLLIEAEDNLYQEASPWRQPIQYRYTAEEMRMRLGVTT